LPPAGPSSGAERVLDLHDLRADRSVLDALAVDHGEWRVAVADALLAGEVRT
jgi:hypothetical protein